MVIAPRAREASVQISLQFDRSRTVDSAAQDVQAAINATAGQLPPTMPNPPNQNWKMKHQKAGSPADS
jgi:multidrug efflux pump subunit AcrB